MRKEATMFCPSCGNSVKDGASFCPKCGRKLEVRQRHAQTPQHGVPTGTANAPGEAAVEAAAATPTVISTPKANSPASKAMLQDLEIEKTASNQNPSAGREAASFEEHALPRGFASPAEATSASGLAKAQKATPAPEDEAHRKDAPTAEAERSNQGVTSFSAQTATKLTQSRAHYLPCELGSIISSAMLVICFFLPIIDFWGSYSIADGIDAIVSVDTSLLSLIFFFLPVCATAAAVLANKYPMLNLLGFTLGLDFFLVCMAFISLISDTRLASYTSYGLVLYFFASPTLAVCSAASLYQRTKR